jgi:hypothetical protein
VRTCSIRCVCGWSGVLALLASLTGCDVQVGEEYRGEPLFSLQGTVILEDPDERRELVPGLVFGTAEESILMEAEVQGEFPARFRMDITEPPPAEVFFPYDPSIAQGSFAIARITAFPRSHPERVPYLLYTGGGEYPDEDGNYFYDASACTPDGTCFQRRLACHEEPCGEIIAQSDGFDLEMGSWNVGTYSYGETSVLFAKGYCTNGTECESAIVRCDGTGLNRYSSVSSDGMLHTCEVVEESGDTSIEQYERYETFARGYSVIYVTEAIDRSEDEHYEPGYNLLHYSYPDDELQLARIQCWDEAERSAYAEYNLEHQTVFDPYDDNDSLPLDLHYRVVELQRACPEFDGYEVIADPLAAPITLVIGREGPLP